jgi:hypothetical protein
MKRWIGLFTILLAVAVVVVVAYRLSAPYRQRAAFERIPLRTTRDEVTKLMGDPWLEEPLEPYGRQLWWIDLRYGDTVYEVWLDDDDQVTGKGRYGPHKWE